MPQSIAGQLAEEMCRRFPQAHTRTLAKKLVDENPAVYTDFEHARQRVRYYRGELGKLARQNRQNKGPTPVGKPVTPTVNLPPSDARPIPPYKLRATGYGAIMSDLHVPYHDPKVIEIAVRHATDAGATDFLIINGDALDCHHLSRFVIDARKRNFAGELAALDQTLRYLQQTWDTIIYKFGNHEARYDRFMQVKAPELLDVPGMELPDLMGLEALGVEHVLDKQVIQAGKLTLVHGHEFGGSVFNPVNAARGLFLRAQRSAVCGHHHHTSEHVSKDLRDKFTACFSTGCLCDLHPEFLPQNKWNHGFALLRFDGSRYDVENKKIIEGEVY